MPTAITLTINGRRISVPPDYTIAAALARSGETTFRHSVTGQPRGPLCGMGICFECRVTINGVAQQRSCQTLCCDGMEVETS